MSIVRGVGLFVGVGLGIELGNVFFIMGAVEEPDYLVTVFGLVIEEHQVLLSLAIWVGLHKHRLHSVWIDTGIIHLRGK